MLKKHRITLYVYKLSNNIVIFLYYYNLYFIYIYLYMYYITCNDICAYLQT